MILHTDSVATVIELVPPGERGPADAILQVPLTNGAWEFDLSIAGDFSIMPVISMILIADVEQDDPRVTVVALREA